MKYWGGQVRKKTDTLTGRHYDPALQATNGRNRWYIVEVPLEIVYNFKRGRWGAGISAGVAPGVVVQSSGRYLRDDESGVTKFQNENTGKLSLNARAGLEFSYLMNKNTRLMLRPSGRYFLTKMDAGNNTKQRYSSVGINAGILYMIPWPYTQKSRGAVSFDAAFLMGVICRAGISYRTSLFSGAISATEKLPCFQDFSSVKAL